jgi:putative DNA primase/helicase
MTTNNSIRYSCTADNTALDERAAAQTTSIIPDKLATVCAADIEPQPVEWLWPGRVAIGKLTIMAGIAGLGKTQLGISMAAVVSRGGPWPCGEGHAPLGSVIIFSAEDSAADTVVPRLIAAGADRQRVRLISSVLQGQKGRRSFNLQSDLALLDKLVHNLGDVRLIIIDPISSYLGALNPSVRGILEPVSEMAERLRVSIVCITHPPKASGIAAINRFLGSVAFVAAARAAYMVTTDPDDEARRLFLPVKNNLAPLGKGLAFRVEQQIVGDPGEGILGSSVVWDNELVNITADQALALAEDRGGEIHSARREAEEFLLELLANGPVGAKEGADHAQALGIAPRTLKRARKKLGVVAQKSGHEGWTWWLPADDAGQGGQESQSGKAGTVDPVGTLSTESRIVTDVTDFSERETSDPWADLDIPASLRRETNVLKDQQREDE